VLHVDGLFLRVVAKMIDLSVPARIIDCCIHLLITVSVHDLLLITPLHQSVDGSNSNEEEEVDCSLLKELWSFVDSMGLLRRPGPDVQELLPRLGLFQSKGAAMIAIHPCIASSLYHLTIIALLTLSFSLSVSLSLLSLQA